MISILIAAYNVANYINKCLDSIRSQTFSDIEVVIVNDFSTDTTRTVIEEYNKTNILNLNLINLDKNHGVSYVRNRCLQEAKGSYCYFLDADDWIEPRAIELLYNAAEETNAEMIGCDFYIDDEKHSSAIKIEVDTVFRMRELNISGRWAVVWRYLFRTSFIRNNDLVFPKNIDGGEDYFFISVASIQATRIAYVALPLYHYRVANKNSLMRSVNIKALKDQFDATELLAAYILEKQLNIKYIQCLNLRYLYLKKEIFKTSLKVWKNWNAQANISISNKVNTFKDKIIYRLISLLSKFL